MPPSLIIVCTFEVEKKLLDSVLLSLCNFETSVITNLRLFNSYNQLISLILVADSISLSCISGLKKKSKFSFEKHVIVLLFLHFFVQEIFVFLFVCFTI